MNGVTVHLYVAVLSMTVWLYRAVLATETRPNIVFILADDLGFRDVGYHGSTVIKTPTLDRLAYNGVRLENYYVQPTCTPSRSQLLSGRYQIHTGLQHSDIHACQPNSLPEEMPTLANMLHDAGYATHMVGKWHIGHYKEHLVPTRRGFDSFFGFLNGYEDYYSHVLCENVTIALESPSGDCSEMRKSNSNSDDKYMTSEFCGFDLRTNETVAANYSGHYSTHLFTQKAVDVIQSHSSEQDTKPFFLYLAYQAVHGPKEVPETYAKPYASIKDKNRTIYAGMTACMDEGVLNVTTALENSGLWNNTILIFSTDNGGSTVGGGNNWPLRGGKASLWEGGMRGVGFVYSPLIKHRGTVNSGLMHVSDWFPTILALAGYNPAGLNFDGFDIWKSISNGEPSPRKEILHNIDPVEPKRGSRLNVGQFDNRVRAAIRVSNWKLITGNPSKHENGWIAPPEDTDHHSIPDPDPESKNIWLFDINKDPTEKTDLFDSHRDIAVDMLNKLAEYQATAVPARYPPDDPRCNPKYHNGFWGPWLP